MKVNINGKITQFDILFIACDPKTIEIDYTKDELNILNNLKSYKIKTTNIKIKNPKNKFPLIDDPYIQNKKEGNVYATRDEYRKYGNPKTFDNEFSYITCYQWISNNNNINFEEILIKDINEKKWLTNIYNKITTDNIKKSFETNYFQHFDSDGLFNNMQKTLLQNQGKNNTFFVSSFTYFESVLHCYKYINLLLIKKDLLKKYSKNSKICIIGSGPSGLLTSCLFLQKLNFTDITVIEKNNNYGGKTQTYYECINSNKITIELGTVYLTKEYEDLIEDLNINGLFKIGGVSGVRSVKLNDIFIDFNEWILNFTNGSSKLFKIINMLDSLFKYLRIYKLIFPGDFSFQDVSDIYKNDLYIKDFKKFMKKYYFESLEGIFIYGYQIQGFGLLNEIPAYYVLISLSPEVIFGFIYDIINQIFNENPDVYQNNVQKIKVFIFSLFFKIEKKEMTTKF